ncbi:MAG: hypothetical protein KJO33_11395, partial [Gammaproteobacteria bacterium]|nr:hypothetical protein [Gammaproteobacteria bacterium]
MNDISLLFRSTAFLLLSALSCTSWAQGSSGETVPELAGNFELPQTFEASAVLQDEMRSGQHFQVREEVGSDGYWGTYTVETKYGTFDAHGWFDLRNLIGEINAIAYLDEFTQTETFLGSATDKGQEP